MISNSHQGHGPQHMTLPDEIENLLRELPADLAGEWSRADMAWVVRRVAERVAERLGGYIEDDGAGTEFAVIFPEDMARGEEHYRRACDVYNKAWEIAYTELLTGWRDTLRLMVAPVHGRIS